MLPSIRHTTRLIALICCAAPLLAQGVATQLGGTISQKGGGPVANAVVTVRNRETGFVRTVLTDAAGRFLAIALPVGPYDVTVTKNGYHTAGGLKVNLNLGDAAPLNVQLAANAEALVEVVANLGQVDGERTTVAAIISPEDFKELPVANRTFTNLATLTPSTTTDTHNGNLAIAGQRGVNTSINIDGGDANEPFFAGAMGSTNASPFMVSMESIKEYQVISGGASAEFGRMGGGYLNAITKGGTNQLEGTFWLYDFPRSLVARQPNLSGVPGSNAVLDFTKYQFGFNFGGPLIENKLFFFINYDGQRQTQPENFQWGGNNPVALNPASTADATLLGQGGNYNTHQNLDTVFLRLDWIASAEHAVSLSIKHNVFQADYGPGQTYSYGNTESDTTRNLALLGEWVWTINSNWLNTFRSNYQQDNLPRSTRSNLPEVYIKNVGDYGANPYPRQFRDSRTQFIDTIQYVEPSFTVKGGFDINNICTAETFSGGYQGEYTFTSLANFEAGNWSNYTQRFAGPGSPGLNGWTSGAFAATEQQIALFALTEIQVTPTVKLNLGLRWDRQTHPDFPVLNFSDPLASTLPLDGRIPTDSEISPRLSATWTPAADHGLVVRASAGRYVSVTPSIFLDQVYASNGQRQESVTFYAADSNHDGIPYGAAFNPANPFSFATLPGAGTTAVPQVISFAPDFKNPHTDQATLGADQAVGHWVFGLSAIYAKSNNLERLDDLNLGTPTANANGREIFPNTGKPVRPNANYGQMLEYRSDAVGLYHAYTATAKFQSPDSPWTAQFQYTYSINKDDDSNERSYNSYSAQNPQQLGAEWGYADSDMRSVLTGMFTYLDSKWSGIEAGLVVKYHSGLPYSILATGVDPSYLGTTGNARLYVNGQDTGRNSQRTCSVTDLDLKLSRDWHLWAHKKLTASAEIFNLMNRQDTYQRLSATSKTDTDPFTVLTTPTVLSTARMVQLGLRFSF